MRIVEGVEGSVPMRMELVIRFDYGVDRAVGAPARRRRARRDRRARRARAADAGRRCAARTSRPSPSSPSRPGERVPFVLTWYPSHHGAAARPVDPEQALERDRCTFWREWLGQLHLRGPLAGGGDALADDAQGADLRADRRHRRGADDVAARADRRRRATGTTATAGCATRRSRSTRCSNAASTTRRRRGATGCCGPSPATRTTSRSCTALAGERRLPELELPWLPGYEGSQPVRVGNGAATQFQLDVYGEVMDVLHQARRREIDAGRRVAGRSSACCSTNLETALATSPTRASGRCAGRAATSRTRR